MITSLAKRLKISYRNSFFFFQKSESPPAAYNKDI